MKKLLANTFFFSIFALGAPCVFAQTPQELFQQGIRNAQYMYENGQLDESIRRNMKIGCARTRNRQHTIDWTAPALLYEQGKYKEAGGATWANNWLKANCSPP